jgi:hypothetical protein
MLPKKNVKYDINVNPPKIGSEFLKYGFDRIETLMNATDEKTKYLPRTIGLEDIDDALFKYVNNGKLQLFIDGNKVPVFYLENERWGEFSQTWKFVDDDKNVKTPYITIRRIDKDPGTRLDKKALVPQQRKFRYLDVPILDEGEIIYLRFKMPEPVNVDLMYEISLFTKYRVDVNQYDEHVLKYFSSTQDYIFVNNSPMPVLLETMEEANNIENIDGDKYLVPKYKLKVLGFIQNEDDFEITKTFRKTKIRTIVTR